jgi:hypothetical protein
MDAKTKYGLTFHKERNERGRPTISILDQGGFNINLNFISMLDLSETECLIESLEWCINKKINDWICLSDLVTLGLSIQLDYPNITILNSCEFPMEDVLELLREWHNILNVA